MALRKRELTALKSVGMTPGAFRRMRSYESLFYGLKALLYGLPAGFAMMLFIRHKLKWVFPWAYSFSRMKKGNILDALREEHV